MDDQMKLRGARQLAAAMLADALARRSGVDGWEVESVSPEIPDDETTRTLYTVKVKPPKGWTVAYAEDGSITPCMLPKTFSFSFATGSGPVVK